MDAHGKFCIFRKLRKDAVPIVAPEERFENIRKAELAWWGNRSLMAILLAPIYFFEFWKLNFEVWIFTDVMLLFLALFLILAIGAICEGIQLAVWCKGKRRKLAKGERIHYGNCGTVGIRRIIFSIAMIGFAIIGIEQQSWVAISLVVTIALLGMVSGIVSIWLLAVNRKYDFYTDCSFWYFYCDDGGDIFPFQSETTDTGNLR